MTFSQAKGIFGFENTSNIGQIGFPAVQAAPALPDTFPHMFGDNKARRQQRVVGLYAVCHAW